jgi:2-dehydropantoate 2-reductase
LIGNVSFNPMSALTRATLEQMVRHPDAAAVIRSIMRETEAVAGKLGIELPVSIDQRMAGAEKVGAHKSSMLQDVETGRPLEIDALVGAVVELAGLLKIPVPHTRTLYATAKLLDRTLRRVAYTAAALEAAASPAAEAAGSDHKAG